ncbi:MAG: hypothetical protein ACN4GM_03730 [Gammaproteobacteria bacterium]
MPIQFKYNQKKDVLYGSIEGRLTFDEFKLMLEQVVESREFRPDVRTLWDLRNLDFTKVDENFERKVTLIRRSFPERSNAKIALVSETEIGFMMSRIYRIFSENLPQNVKVFKNYIAGEDWLLGE